ncbi:MAG: hypothetical protein WA212_15235, partial [Candidatus Acidiferrales bacterium]
LVTISDNHGHLTSQPREDELVVHDDGKSAQVEALRPVKDDLLVFSLLVDASGSSRHLQDSQVATVNRLFQTLSARGNHGYLIVFGSDEDVRVLGGCKENCVNGHHMGQSRTRRTDDHKSEAD